MAQPATHQSAMAVQEAMLLHLRGGGNTPPTAMEGLPPFSTRKDRYVPTLAAYDPKFYSIAARGSETEALAFSFAGRLREDFPEECEKVSGVNKSDVLRFFDWVDVQLLGLPMVKSILEKMAWSNTTHEESLTNFIDTWTKENLDRFKIFMNTDVVIWNKSEEVVWGRRFLRDALKYLLRHKNRFLRSPGNAYNHTLALTSGY